jgi:diguanylate cyclase (GGDEF)-like protein
MDYRRPFRTEELARRATPFALAGGFAFVAIPFPPESIGIVSLMFAAACNGLVFMAAMVLSWGWLPRIFDLLPPLLYLMVIGFLRDALGGAHSGYEALVMLPVLWIALYGTARQMTAMLIGVSALFIIPLVWVGAPQYPDADWRTMVMWTAVSAIMGSAVQQLVARVRALIRTDELTGLFNRPSILTELSREFVRYRRERDRLAVAMFAIDDLGDFVEEHGNKNTDHLLATCAAEWKKILRATDSLGRYGDNQFLLLLPACPQANSVLAIDRLRGKTPFGCTLSAGVTGWDGEMDVDEIVDDVARLMKVAKQQGPGSTHLHEEANPEVVAGSA